VGVAADVRTTGIEHDASLTVYHPYWYRGYAPTVLVRTTGDPAALTNSVRAALRQFAPSVPISHIRTIDQVVSTVVAQRRFELVLIGLFAITALLTASIGIYGIISHSLSRRANELGIRIALGARSVNVHALILREVLTPVALGLIGGVIASRVMSGIIAGLLYEVRPTDAGTFAAVALLLAIVATVACWIPTRRATRIDPVEALRAG
jgi:ABC-type antimicrobial peptide transport system permease subunit